MKKSQLKKIIKEELLKEVKGGVLNYFYNQGYSAGQMLNPLVDELIKTKGLEGAKKHIGSLVGDEPQYDMSSHTPFGEGALKEETQVAYDGEIDRLLNLITSDLAKGYTNLEKLNDVAFDAKDEYNNGFSKALDAMGDVESYLMDGVTEYDGEPGWEDRIR